MVVREGQQDDMLTKNWLNVAPCFPITSFVFGIYVSDAASISSARMKMIFGDFARLDNGSPAKLQFEMRIATRQRVMNILYFFI